MWALLAVLSFASCSQKASEDNSSSASVEDISFFQADVLAHPIQTNPSEPLVVEVPRFDEKIEDDNDEADMTVMLSYLDARLSGAGISLSSNVKYRICEELGSEFRVYSCGYKWIQYGDFGLLVLILPAAAGKADTCYVFEKGLYKGFINPQGGIHTEDCIVTFEDDIWLETYRHGRGTGLGEENRFWYRLTENSLPCELRYTFHHEYTPVGVYYVFYDEKVTGIEQGKYEYAPPVVTTSSLFRVQDNYDDSTCQFTYEKENKYSLYSYGRGNGTFSDFEDERQYILTHYQPQIIDILQNGTPDQKESIHSLLKFWDVESQFLSSKEKTELYQLYYDLYKEYVPQ